jgi:hypothetical protein
MPRPPTPPDASGAPDAIVVHEAPGAPDALGALGALDSMDALDRWLAAERSTVDAGVDADPAGELAAEAAFAELLVGLPRPAPPQGFADRVLARARRAPGRRWLGWRARPGRSAWGLPAVPAAAMAAVVALLALLGLPAASGVVAAMAARLGATSIAGLLQASVEGVIAAGQWLADVVDFGDTLVLLVRAVTAPLATPPMAALAAACLLVSVLAARCLVDLIQRDRRWVYADPI